METLLTAQEAAKMFNVHPNTIYKGILNGDIPACKLPGIGIRLILEEIEEWASGHSTKRNQISNILPKLDITLDSYDKLFLERRTEMNGVVRYKYPFGSVLMRKTNNKEERYYIHYQVDGQRVRKALKGVRTRAEAVKVLNAEVSDAQRGKYHFQKRKITFKEMADLFLEKYSEPNKRSWKSTDRVYTRNMKPFFGEIKLAKITPLMIEDYKIERLSNGKGRRPGERVSNSTINRELQCLRKMFNKAIDWGFATQNPVNKVDFLPEDENPRKRMLSLDEEARFAAVAPPYLLHIVLVAAYTGMRREKVLTLRWEHVDFGKKEVEVVKSKSGKDRIMEMHDNVFNLLTMLRLKNGQSEYVFVNPRTGKPYMDIRRSFKTACKKAGITGLHFHDLRHTFGSRLAWVTDLNTVKESMGHAKLTTTQRYLHSNAERKREAVNSMARHVYDFGLQWQNSDKRATSNDEADAITPS